MMDVSIESQQELISWIMCNMGPSVVNFLTTLHQEYSRLPREQAEDLLLPASEKMARVVFQCENDDKNQRQAGFTPHSLFKRAGIDEPEGYLTRAIYNLYTDQLRRAQREPRIESLDAPLGMTTGGILTLRDSLSDPGPDPAEICMRAEESRLVRLALADLRPADRNTILDWLRREAAKQQGLKLPRQTAAAHMRLSRARKALIQAMEKQLGERIAQPHRPALKPLPPPVNGVEWTEDSLRTISASWQQRAKSLPEGIVEGARFHTINAEMETSPDLITSEAVRHVSRWEHPATPTSDPQIIALYNQAYDLMHTVATNQSGEEWKTTLQQAERLLKQVLKIDPKHRVTLVKLGTLYVQRGHIAKALQIDHRLLRSAGTPEERSDASNNIAYDHLILYDAGHNAEEHIQEAIRYAHMGMEVPSPLNVRTLLLAYVKDRRWLEAARLMEEALTKGWATCSPEQLIPVLAELKDRDLLAFYGWLEEVQKEKNYESA